MMYKLGSVKALDYRNYITAQAVNRGDEAIAIASRTLFQKNNNNIRFVNKNWGELCFFSSIDPESSPCTIAVCGGGYLFFDQNGQLAKRVEDDLQVMSETLVPVFLFGIGVNRLLKLESAPDLTLTQKDQQTLTKLLNRASLISVRDQGTKNLLTPLTEKPIHLIGDPAFLMSEKGRHFFGDGYTQSSTQPLRISINLPFHGPAAAMRIRADLPKYIEIFKSIQAVTKCQFTYMIHYDTEIILYKILRAAGIQLQLCKGTPAQLIQCYESQHVHMGGMLHSCIMAASAGTPCVALAYDVKHAGFFELLGLSNFCLPVVPLDVDLVVKTTLNAIKNEQQLRRKIVEARLRLEAETAGFIAKCADLINQGVR